jgi:hypothetical protein
MSSKSWKKSNCHPSRKKNKESCFNKDDLLLMKNKWNQLNPDKKIYTENPESIYKELKLKYEKECDRDSCILKKLTNSDIKKLESIFAPSNPPEWNKNPHEWLSNFDIEAVMKQYQETYPYFEFIGSSSINFDTKVGGSCVCNHLCNFQLKEKLNKGIHKIGISFNLDRHDQKGSHWVSLFIDCHPKYLYYFDSTGDKCPQDIQRFVAKVVQQAKELNHNYAFYQNHPFEHQMGDSECGMYSLYFLIHMLEGEADHRSWNKKRIKDDDVFQYRSRYFNNDQTTNP